MKQYYTDKKYKELLSHMVVLVDSREQSNKNVTDWFDRNNIKWKSRALKTGDYGFMVESCPELGFSIDTYFSDELCIERKNSVSELAGNIANATKDDDRIFKEFNRMINIEKNYLLIENDSIEDIFTENYKSKLNPTSFFRTLLTWQSRNNMHIYFVEREYMGRMIYELCKNCLDSKILK
jgi:ERCC4-type nuclease